jgi:hypothetical protein
MGNEISLAGSAHKERVFPATKKWINSENAKARKRMR